MQGERREASHPADGKMPLPSSTLRATWIASAFNLDWPSAASSAIQDPVERAREQLLELDRIIEESLSLGLTCLVFQVKPCADALYRSSLLPWSPVLARQHGGDPGFDPLAELLARAHAAGLQVHAWLNPYRVSMNVLPTTIDMLRQVPEGSPASVFVQHPEWIREAGGRLMLDPGEPGVIDWLVAVVQELAERYAVDGIQFDDYFYAETPASPLADGPTFARDGRGFRDKADWRRDNTLRMVMAVRDMLRVSAPGVRFGISPAGVWRNRSDDPQGSETQAGAPNYDVAFADTRRWVKEGLIDYIVPQIYWPFARSVARYDVILRWWADTARGTGVDVYAGMALYKVGTDLPAEPDWQVEEGVPEFTRQLDLNDALPEVGGCMMFRHTLFRPVEKQAVRRMLQQRWATRDAGGRP